MGTPNNDKSDQKTNEKDGETVIDGINFRGDKTYLLVCDLGDRTMRIIDGAFKVEAIQVDSTKLDIIVDEKEEEVADLAINDIFYPKGISGLNGDNPHVVLGGLDLGVEEHRVRIVEVLNLAKTRGVQGMVAL